MKGRPRQRVAPCGYCNKEFKRQEHLDRHLRTHTKERPYACSCGRMFSRQDLLHRHHRLSQCTAEGMQPFQVRDHGASPSESIAISPPLSSGSNVQTPPFHVSQDRGHPLSSRLASQTGSGLAPLVTATPSINTGDYSQGELMSKFSVYDLNAELLQRRSADFIPTGKNIPHLESTDPPAGFSSELPPFEMDFLFDEADMINSHLSEVFPPIDYQLSASFDSPEDYGSIQGLNPVVDPLATTPSRDMEKATAPAPGLGRSEATQSQGIGTDEANRSHRGRGRNGLASSLGDTDDTVPTNPWDVSGAAYGRLSTDFARYQDIVEPFSLPSRRTISRYVASWARSYHPHLPVIHLPTNNFDRRSPMLLLTIAAIGPFYGFEHSSGYPMCFVAREIVREKLEKRRRASSLHLLKGSPCYAEMSGSTSRTTPRQISTPQRRGFDLELLQSLLILVMSMAWLDGPLAQEALAWSSQLAELTREALKVPIQHYPISDWEDWALEEERRRTIYSAYFTLNILTICFRVPPEIPPTEINLPLPSSEAEFKAANSDAWQALQRQGGSSQLSFQQCFKQLLQGVPLPKRDVPTEFGNYMLMQSLLIQIYFERQAAACLLSSSSSLQSATISLYDSAFSAWQSCWDSAIDSALDPSSPHGPLAFNSTAMLRLAHVNLAVDIQGHCSLSERDPEVLARAFEPGRSPVPLQSEHLDHAVMHAINALRIPIRVGIAFVARGRTGHWSVQHAISNFSCALLLTHWLENIYGAVSQGGMAALRHEEKCLLSMVERLIEETHLEDSLGGCDEYPSRIRRAAIAALRLWAETCKGIQVFEIIHAIGETLSVAANALERRGVD